MTFPLTKSKPDSNREEWEVYPIPSMIGGINTQERPDALKPNQMVDVLNMIAYKMELRKDTGYAILGVGPVLDSKMRREVEYIQNDGTRILVGITNGSVYIYKTTVREWQYVKGAVGTDLNGNHVIGNTTLTVDSSAGFTAGDKIGIRLTSGRQQRTTVDTVPGGGVTITIPAPGLLEDAADESPVIQAVALSGSDNFSVMALNVPSNSWLVFTNNVDNVKRYDGVDCVDVPGLVQTTCQSVALYNAALFLLNTTEGGQSHPTRVRRSEIGRPDVWSGGTAGFDDLLDTDGPVLNGDLLGPYFIVYKNRTIYRGQFIGSGGVMYKFDPMLHGDNGEGLVATDVLVNIGTCHIFMGNSNFYQYFGDFALLPIGDPVFFLLFAADADVSAENLDRSFALFIEGLQEVWFFYPGTLFNWPNNLLRYKVPGSTTSVTAELGTNTGSWIRREFHDNMVSGGTFLNQSSFAWEDLIGIWSDQTWAWNSRIASGNLVPAILLSPETGNVVYIYDFITGLDFATTITGQVVTRDFFWGGGQFRSDRIEGYLQGINVRIEYSTDQGVSWTDWETVSNADMGRFISYRQVVCQNLRFRFSCSDPNFRLRWFSLTWRPESVG
jgi:hypothetical protein